MSALANKGFAQTLALLNWDVFATYTFKNPLPIERRCWRLIWRHLHEASQSFGRPYSKLLIALRSERGEVGDRFHFHLILGGSGSSNFHSMSHWLAHEWARLTQGHAEVRPWDPQLAGADYLEKCLGGGNLYELGKFNKADRLELSASVFRAVNFGLRSYWQHNAGKGMRKNTGADEVPASVLSTGVNLALSQVRTSPLPQRL